MSLLLLLLMLLKSLLLPEFDISDVLFLCTANVQQNIPPALKDRMEVINLSGYTELEKEHIAQKHLIPKQIDENGLNLKKNQF